MTRRSGSMRVARCSCGECRLSLEGAPIMTAICYCKSCRSAGHVFERLPGAAPVLGEDVSITVADDGSVFLNDTVQVVTTDIQAANGIIHVIDAVLLPAS